MPTVKAEGYNVIVDKGWEDLHKFILKQKASKIFVIVDENTEEHCLPVIRPHLPDPYKILKVRSGETFKNIDTATYLWQQLVKHEADRSSLVLNLGGGVIGDMGGFVASTYMRGIPFIQIPTTLLSQVDASVGGKLGVDFMGYKNIIGMFKNPIMVWVHSPFIKTLPEKELASGFAEVIKHTLIRSKSWWEKIKSKGLNQTPEEWSKLIYESIKIKNKVVLEDPYEQGLRKILNFGHTIGHAIESYFLNSKTPLLHGEAIAKGMIAEAYLSFKNNKLTIIELEEINSLIETIYTIPTIENDMIDDIIRLMKMDKKNKAGKKLFSLIEGIGNCSFDEEVTDERIKESLKF